MDSFYLPLAYVLGRNAWPSSVLASDQLGVLDHLFVSGIETDLSGSSLAFHTRFFIDAEVALGIPGLPWLTFALSPTVGGTDLPIDITFSPFKVQIKDLPVVARVARTILQPMKSLHEPDASKATTDIVLGAVTLTITSEGHVEIQARAEVTLPLCMIGQSGVVIEAQRVRWLTPADSGPVGANNPPSGFTGLYIADAQVHLPEIDFLPSLVKFDECYIGTGGFTGQVSLSDTITWDPTRHQYAGKITGELFGYQCGITSIEIAFVQSCLQKAALAGEVFVPYLDKRIGVDLFLSLTGDFTLTFAGPRATNPDAGVSLRNDGLLQVSKQGIADLTLDSIALEKRAEDVALRLSGKIQPLLVGLNWPEFDIKALIIHADGQVDIEGGWLTLRKQKPLNFYGFQMEITRLGFGKTEDGGKWIGFSGGVKLVEGLPAGASVEGLRIVWYDDGSKAPSVTFNGVGVEFQVPGVLTFKGSVAYSGLLELPRPEGVEKIQRFDGDIKLKLVALNMEIDATLVIGSASGPRGNYTFFAIYLGVELPAGIPLWSTGVALYGMAGLFATQMEPNKRDDEGWYENPTGDPGWYKRGTPGVTDLKTKWDPRLGSLAFGVGATLGTLPDNGTSFHGKFLLVIVFPGPIVLLEGRGDLLKKRASPDKPGATTIVEEPLFRSLAVLDNRVGTFTIGLDAQYKYNTQGALIDIHGGAEAFFSFSDANAWHIYLGRDEPVEHRIHALIFKNLFEANAYFLLDPSSVRTGAWMGIDKNWSFGPLVVKLEAFIDGKAVISRKPAHFYGHLLLHGDIGLSVFGFGATLNVDAECAADVFDPFHVRFDFHVGIDLPWFLPDFDVDFSTEWGPEPVPPPLPLPLQEVAIEHLKVTTKWPLPRDGSQPLLLPDYDSDNDGFLNPPTGASQPSDLKALPVVPLDSRPHITFGRAMNDDALVGVNVQPGNGVWERIGDPSQNQGPVKVRYGLTGIALHKWDSGTGTWKLVARKGKTGSAQDDALAVPALYGSWAPVPSETGSDGAGVAQTKLWLWSKNPFDYTRHSGRAWDEWFISQFSQYPCAPSAPDQEICCDVAGIDPGRLSPPQWQCPDHPEIGISWGAPDGSIHPDQATITLPLGAKGVKITLSQEHVGHVRRCINFAQYPTGPGSNPRIERRVKFAVSLPDPNTGQLILAPQTRVTIPTGVALAGLDCGFVLEITLPRPCFLIEMNLTSKAHSTHVEAFNADGSSAGVPVPVPQGQLQRLQLKGTAITRVVVAGEGETVLHELCFEHFLITVTGSDSHGDVHLSTSGDDGTIEVFGTDLTSVEVSGEGTVQLEKVCVVLPPDPAEMIRREEMQKHFVDELARWSQEGDVLEPDTTYRLKVVTRVEAESDQHLNGYTQQGNVYRLIPEREQTEYAYFRTEGPPGLTYLSAPTGTANPPLTNAGTVAVTNGSPNVSGSGTDWSDRLVGAVLQVGGEVTGYTIAQVTASDKLVLRRAYLGSTHSGAAYSISQFDSGLDDLTRYVRQTVPATVPPEGTPPLLPRPVYRAYDMGVEFNENYVDLLYRMARRDLGLYLYNSNNQPVRDARGRLIVLSNRWGVAEQLTLTEGEERWLTVVNDCTNGKLDEQKVPPARTLFSAAEGQILDADTVYEARLVPLLLHEDFTEGLAEWKSVDEATPASKWEVQGHKAITGQAATATGTVVKLDGTPDLSKVKSDFDTILLDKDTARPSGHYRILSVDAPAKTVTVDGTPNLAGGSSPWQIAAWGTVVQASSTGGGTSDGKDPVKPGTILLRGDPNWTDYRLSLFLRATTNDDALGVIFRHTDPYTYYRFSMDRQRAYRRLVRVISGTHTILAEDDFIYRQNVDYLITVEAIGTSLRVYQGGALVFAVTDSAIPGGRIGLYCWSNVGARFSDVRVDDFSKEAPIAYRFKFTTSQFTNFLHHLHSYQDETWRVTADISALLTQGVSPTTAPSEAEQRAYERLATQVLGVQAHQNPAEVQVTRVEHNDQVLALLVQTPEPLDWQRTDLKVLRTDRYAPSPHLPGVVKLTDVSIDAHAPNKESVTLLLREATKLTGYRIEQRQLPGPLTESGRAPALFMDEFNGADSGVLFREEFGPNALDHYTIVDEQPPGSFASNWKVANGRIEQHGDYRGGPPSGDLLPTRPGTIALLTTGDYSHAHISLTLRSDSQRDIGLVFRYQDSDNYYRLSLARYDVSLNAPFRRLVKRVGGTTSVLWQDSVSYDATQPTHLVVEIFGDRLIGYVDNALLFSVRDPDIAQGRVGLYCWGNTGAYFEALQVESLVSDPILWQPSFIDMSGLEIVDEPGTSGGPSTWSAHNGVLTQSSSIQGEDTAWQQQPGLAYDIAVGEDGSIWCTLMAAHRAYTLYRWNGSDWDSIAEGATGGVRIAVEAAGLPWVVDDAQQIFRWDGNAFQQMPGSAYDIAAGPGTTVYIVGKQGRRGGAGIYYWDTSSWQMLDSGALVMTLGPASRIAVTPDGIPWVVNDAQQIFVFNWNSLTWQQQPGTASDIGIGADGSIWIAGTDAMPGGYRIYRWNASAWEEMTGIGAVGIAVGPDGNPWVVSDNEGISKWIGNVYHKPGTYVLGDSSAWKDVQISGRLRSDGSGAIGVMFRYVDADNYYRFSMDRQGNYRRLIKSVGGKVTKLWEDQVQYSVGQTYELTICTTGGWLSVYLDGVLLCTVYDVDIKRGRAGLYCHANTGARFERMVVKDYTRRVGQWIIRDEVQTGEPSQWRLTRGELSQTSGIGSSDALAGFGTLAVAGDSAWTNYRLIARLRSDTDDAIGLIFRYVDDDNYYRLSMDTERKYRRLVKKVNGVITKLWEKAGGFTVSEPFTLTVEVAGSQLAGYMDDESLFEVTDNALTAGQVGLYCWGNTAAHFEWIEVRRPSLEASALLRDRFTESDMSGWLSEDEGTQDFPSDWTIFEGVLRQTSNIHTPLNPRDPLSMRGTQVVAGDPNWTDVVISTNLESPTGSAIGVLFRYNDKDHYYRFSMDSVQGYRRLVKNVNGTFTLLWEDTLAYEIGRSYELIVVAAGSLLRGYMNGVPLFVVEDASLAAGSIGLYCWANTDARFSQVRVYPVEQAFNTWLLDEPFDVEVSGRWTFVDENSRSISSEWQVTSGELQHTPSSRGAADTSGTYAVAGDPAWTDYRIIVPLCSNEVDGGIGAIFRYKDVDNYYCFLMDKQGSKRRLIKKTAGVVTKVWEDAAQYTTGHGYVLTLDCIGERFTGYLDGVQVFAWEDGDHATGQVGLYCWTNTDARFAEVRVAEPVWEAYYTFNKEALMPAGTRVRIYSGSLKDAPLEAEPGVVQRFSAPSDTHGYLHWPKDGVDLRIRPRDGDTGHARRFLPADAYTAIDPKDLRVLRKADGTGFCMLPPGALPGALAPGEYRLELIYHRKVADPNSQVFSEAGNSSTESVTIDIPRL